MYPKPCSIYSRETTCCILGLGFRVPRGLYRVISYMGLRAPGIYMVDSRVSILGSRNVLWIKIQELTLNPQPYCEPHISELLGRKNPKIFNLLPLMGSMYVE